MPRSANHSTTGSSFTGSGSGLRYCGLRQATSTRRSPSASPPAYPQSCQVQVAFSPFTDRQRACFFFRVGEHSGQITSTSPEACAGSSIRKSAQLLVIQPPLVLLVLSLPQSRPLDQRGA